MKFRIQRFDPAKTNRRCTWLVIGPRNTGKSTLVKDLLYTTSDRYDVGMAMTGTSASADSFREFMPRRLVHPEGYDFDVADNMMAMVSGLVANDKGREVLFVGDDLAFDQRIYKTRTQKEMHLNGRHNHMTLFNTTQYSTLVPSVCRANVDYVIACRESILANRKRLYDHYFGMFPTFGDFCRVFDQCTRDYKCMVLDKTRINQTPNECIFWYKARKSVPPFRLGKRLFFRLSDAMDASAKRIKQKNNQEAAGADQDDIQCE